MAQSLTRRNPQTANEISQPRSETTNAVKKAPPDSQGDASTCVVGSKQPLCSSDAITDSGRAASAMAAEQAHRADDASGKNRC